MQTCLGAFGDYKLHWRHIGDRHGSGGPEAEGVAPHKWGGKFEIMGPSLILPRVYFSESIRVQTHAHAFCQECHSHQKLCSNKTQSVKGKTIHAACIFNGYPDARAECKAQPSCGLWLLQQLPAVRAGFANLRLH